MAVKFSTGLRNSMLGTTGLKDAMADGVLRIYSGAQPTSADNAPGGTLLLEITLDAGAFVHGSPTNGLEFDAPSAGTVSKAAAETWRGLGLVAGTAGWARFSANPLDDNSLSTTIKRIDMSVAKTGADLNIANTSIAVGAPTTIDVFQLTMAG